MGEGERELGRTYTTGMPLPSRVGRDVGKGPPTGPFFRARSHCAPRSGWKNRRPVRSRGRLSILQRSAIRKKAFANQAPTR